MTSAPRVVLLFALLPACGGVVLEKASDGGVGDSIDAVSPTPPDATPTTTHSAPDAAAPPPDLLIDSGTRFDAGPQCTPLPGCTSTTSCPEGDGCHECLCAEGLFWSCPVFPACAGGELPSIDGGVCPTTVPGAGAPCDDTLNVMCLYAACNSSNFACESAGWTRVWGDVCSPPPPGP
jgi:hypothetical protein